MMKGQPSPVASAVWMLAGCTMIIPRIDPRMQVMKKSARS